VIAASSYCQSSDFKDVSCQVTGHRVVVNLSVDKIFVPPTIDIGLVRELACDPAAASGSKPQKTRYWCGYRPVRDAWSAFREVETHDDVMRCIDRLLAVGGNQTARNGSVQRSLLLLQRFWSNGLIAMPPRLPRHYGVSVPLEAFGLCAQQPWIDEFKSIVATRAPLEAVSATRFLVRAAWTATGIRCIGDVTPATVSPSAFAELDIRRRWYRHIHTAQVRHHGAATADAVYYSWGIKTFGVRTRSDSTFAWAAAKDPGLAAWRAVLSEWFAHRKAKAPAMDFSEGFLNYLLAHSTVTRSPEVFCRRVYANPAPFLESSHCKGRASEVRISSLGHEFIEWFLDHHLSSHDDAGRPVRSPDHWNPFPRKSATSLRYTESTRQALPTRFIRQLIAVLTENDWAWPKTLKTDWIDRFNSTTQKWEPVWNPVRASAMLLKLLLPLRTFQVRMLESGEGDTECYAGGRWVRNESELAPKTRKAVRRGFLRAYPDRSTGRVYTGFFVNTNKTAPRRSGDQDPGYEMPWQHDHAIQVVERLIEWQRTYNPVEGPTAWSSLHELNLVRQGRPRTGSAFFLMRDAGGTYPNEPLTDTRMRPFWAALMEELERRLCAGGETHVDGSPIQLIAKRSVTGAALRPIHDLHTLRVSIITALATDGGVPLHILSKCIAGHASVLMTLYYVKLDASHVANHLAEASARIARAEQGNFVQFLKSAEGERREAGLVRNDSEALAALDRSDVASWIVSDKGICPVGGRMCHRGGPQSLGSPPSPVPGGAKNCVRCRYFITGPAFLGGLVAHFNAVGLSLTLAAERLRSTEKAIEALENERADCEKLGPKFVKELDMDAARHRFDQVMMEVDSIAHNWHAIYSLVERSKAVLANQKSTAGINLVLGGTRADLDVALEATSDFELMNAVCQVASLHPAPETAVANLKRARLLDALLVRNSCTPIFAEISEEEALRVGNEFVNLMIARLGRATTVELIEGKRMLEATGLTQEVRSMLKAQVGVSAPRMPVLEGEPTAKPPQLRLPHVVLEEPNRVH
jgi:Putative phage integrase